MREIKFRVWNKGGNNMLYDIDNVFECLKQQIKFDNSMPDRGFVVGYDHRSDGMVWQQFTGLKDKNGKEIYEGDIVLFQKKNYEIRYFTNHGMFGLVGENSYSSNMIDESKPMGSRGSSTNYKPYVLNEYYQKRIEVIGNIHENPELLQ